MTKFAGLSGLVELSLGDLNLDQVLWTGHGDGVRLEDRPVKIDSSR